MEIGRIAGCTRTVGQSQGYLGLPIRDEIMLCDVGGYVPVMMTAHFPTPAEIAAINAGAPVLVGIQGTVPAPMFLTVGEPPED